MSVLVDSDVWSSVFRRDKPNNPVIAERLQQLIEADEAHIIGIVRQEVLSGIREKSVFLKLRTRLRIIPDMPITQDIHELAASFYNICRTQGVQGSHTDFLICACAVSWRMKILSCDGDYRHYARWIPIVLDMSSE